MLVNGIIAALAGAAVAAVLVLVAAKLIPRLPMAAASPAEAESRKEILDRILTLVGGVFAFLLGLVIVTNWQVMTASRQTTIDEVNGLSQIYSAAHALPEPQHSLIRNSVLGYVNTVIHVEWPLMSKQEMSRPAQLQIDALRDDVQNWDISTPRLAAMQGQALSGMTAAYSARRARAMEAEEGLPPLMWGMLAGLGFIMLSVPLLKGIHVTRTTTILYISFGVMLALALWFVSELNYPFSGGLTVKPDAYLIFLQQASPPSH